MGQGIFEVLSELLATLAETRPCLPHPPRLQVGGCLFILLFVFFLFIYAYDTFISPTNRRPKESDTPCLIYHMHSHTQMFIPPTRGERQKCNMYQLVLFPFRFTLKTHFLCNMYKHFLFIYMPPLLLLLLWPSFCRFRLLAFIKEMIRLLSIVCSILVAICWTWSASSRTGNLEARKRQKGVSLHFCVVVWC